MAISNGKVLLDRFPRDSPDDMYAELQSQTMDIFGERAKTLILAIDEGGSKAIRHWVVSTVGIDLINEPLGGFDVARILEKPSFIDDRILPTERLQRLC
jgi:hypothetical protein